METTADNRALLIDAPNQVIATRDDGLAIVGVLARPFEQSLDINGRRTIIRALNVDVVDVVVGDQLSVDGSVYAVREVERGLMLSTLVLERA